jgi:hypothetical protein
MTTNLKAAAIVAAMAIGSLALWIAIPAAWLWLTRDLDEIGTRFLVVVPGCAITMLLAGALLFRLEAMHSRATGKPGSALAPAGWLRSVGEEGRSRRSLTLLESLLVGSALIAILALVAWWAFLADSPSPSGPLQPL